jgi:hypothetical protein
MDVCREVWNEQRQKSLEDLTAVKVYVPVSSAAVPPNDSLHYQFLDERTTSIFILQVNRFGMWGVRGRSFVS